jgi:hypothetical protein
MNDKKELLEFIDNDKELKKVILNEIQNQLYKNYDKEYLVIKDIVKLPYI